MANFAVVDNDNVLNTIVAESKEIAEQVTGKTCIEFTTEPAEPGGTFDGTDFIRVKPYPSWILNEEKDWEAPTERPTEEGKFYTWDEENASWVEHNLE